MKFSNVDEIGNYVYSLSDPETNKNFILVEVLVIVYFSMLKMLMI